MDEDVKNEIIVGKNAVISALKAKHNIDTIYLSGSDKLDKRDNKVGGKPDPMGKIKALARENAVVVKMATPQKLDELSEGVANQGVVAVCPCADYASVDDILAVSKQKGTDPFIIIADEIEDPHNLGALIRTACAVGADGLIIPKRRSASLTAAVHKTSAGAASILPVAKVSNLVACIKELKEQNIWIYGADLDGKSWCEHNYSGGVALVIGSEGSGIGRLIKEQCDFIATIPMCKELNSLNASVAGGVLMYEVVRQRIQAKK